MPQAFEVLTLSTLNATKVALASQVRHCCSRLLSFLVPLVVVRMRSVSDWHRPFADKNWKWPILSERSGQNGLSKLENPAQMADHFFGIPARASPVVLVVHVLQHADLTTSSVSYRHLVIMYYRFPSSEWAFCFRLLLLIWSVPDRT